MNGNFQTTGDFDGMFKKCSHDMTHLKFPSIGRESPKIASKSVDIARLPSKSSVSGLDEYIYGGYRQDHTRLSNTFIFLAVIYPKPLKVYFPRGF